MSIMSNVSLFPYLQNEPLTATLLGFYPTAGVAPTPLPATQPLAELAAQVADEFAQGHSARPNADDLRHVLTEIVDEIVPLARPDILFQRLYQMFAPSASQWPAPPTRRSFKTSLNRLMKAESFAPIRRNHRVQREQYVNGTPNLWAGLSVMIEIPDDNTLCFRIIVKGLEVWPDSRNDPKARLVMLQASREYVDGCQEWLELSSGFGLYSPDQALYPLSHFNFIQLEAYPTRYELHENSEPGSDDKALVSFEAAYRVLQPALEPLLSGTQGVDPVHYKKIRIRALSTLRQLQQDGFSLEDIRRFNRLIEEGAKRERT